MQDCGMLWAVIQLSNCESGSEGRSKYVSCKHGFSKVIVSTVGEWVSRRVRRQSQ